MGRPVRLTGPIDPALAGSLARLERMRQAAIRTTVGDFAAKDDYYRWSGLAWEALRNASDRGALERWCREPRLAEPARALVAHRDVHRFCAELETIWRRDIPTGEKVTALLLASAVLVEHTDVELWLPIEGAPLLFVLSRLYREIVIRAYDRGCYLVDPVHRTDNRRPRWQPYLGSAAFPPDYALPGRPDVLRAFLGIHELCHVVNLKRPPADSAQGLPLRYLGWMLGNEAISVSAQQWVECEVLSRVPHPYLVSVFNTPPSDRGFQLPPAIPAARQRSALLAHGSAVVQAMQSLECLATEGRGPEARVLRTIQSPLPVAKGFVWYSLKEWPVLRLGLRGQFLQDFLADGEPDNGRHPAHVPYVEAVRGMWDTQTRLAEAQHRQGRLDSRLRLLAWRAAEMHDLLWRVFPASRSLPSLEATYRRAAALQGKHRSRDLDQMEDDVATVFGKEQAELLRAWLPEHYLTSHPSWIFPIDGTNVKEGPEFQNKGQRTARRFKLPAVMW